MNASDNLRLRALKDIYENEKAHREELKLQSARLGETHWRNINSTAVIAQLATYISEIDAKLSR